MRVGDEVKSDLKAVRYVESKKNEFRRCFGPCSLS